MKPSPQETLPSDAAVMSADFEQFLKDQGYIDIKFFDDVVWAAINPFLFTYGIIMGQIGDRFGLSDRWCYHTYQSAKVALDAWDGNGEPTGWHRHPASGRRVDEEGNSYVAH